MTQHAQPLYLRIFVSSPGDVADERGIVLQLFDRLQYDPLLRGQVTIEAVAWDKRGGDAPMLATMTPQEAINQGLPKPSECDIVVVIFWSRMGTPLPPEYTKVDGSRYLSGTEWEYENAIHAARERGIPKVVIYRRTEDISLNPRDPDFAQKLEQWQRVEAFFAAFVNSDGSIRQGSNLYTSPAHFGEKFETHLKVLIKQILGERQNISSTNRTMLLEEPPLWQGSPFPGLRAFSKKDAPIFFGRSRQIDALIERLRFQRFVAVVGASGSGKSSLVRAGLLPRLERNAIASSETASKQWQIIEMTPSGSGTTKDPFEALFNAVIQSYPELKPNPFRLSADRNAFIEQLHKTTQPFFDICQAILHPLPEWAEIVFFVDQFEEIFTLIDEKERSLFVALLNEVANHNRTRVIVTLRSDFYDQSVASPELAALLQQGSFPLSIPTILELGEMIVRPAERAGLELEPGLADQIVSDVGVAPGRLALMGYLLDELYNVAMARNDKRLSLDDYDSLGGVRGAISNRAEATFGALPGTPDQKLAALIRVFRELVLVNEHGIATRKHATRAAFEGDELAEATSRAFENARLLISDRGIIEVAHEALLHSWTRLASWIESVREDLQLLRQVQLAADDWASSGQMEAFEWKYERLLPVQNMLNRIGITPDGTLLEFMQSEYKRLLRDVTDPQTSDYRRKTLGDRFVEISDGQMGFATSELRKLIRFGHPEVRVVAARVLAKLADPSTLEDLRTALRDFNKSVKLEAIRAIASISTGESLKILVEAVNRTRDQELRTLIASELGRMGAHDATPILLELVNDRNFQVRQASVSSLGALKAIEAVDVLRRVLHEKEPQLQHAAISALEQIGTVDALSELIQLWKNQDVNIREKLRNTLTNTPASVLLPVLVTEICHPNAKRRQLAAEVITVLDSTSAITIVREALRHQSADVRTDATNVLRSIDSADSIAMLTNLLGDHDTNVRQKAVDVLRKIGDADAVRVLLSAAEDNSSGVSGIAKSAIAKLSNAEGMTILLPALQSADAQLRLAAVTALGRIGSTRTVTVPTTLLIDSLSDSYKDVRRATVNTLTLIGSDEALDLLCQAFSNPYEDVRNNSIKAVGKIGNARAIPYLVTIIQNDDYATRYLALESLAEVADVDSVPALIELLKLPDLKVCGVVVDLLGTIGGADATKALIDQLNNSDWVLREQTISALRTTASSESIPVIKGAILNEDPAIRRAAVMALGRVGNLDAGEELIRVLGDSDTDVVMEAISGLGYLRYRGAVVSLSELLNHPDFKIRRKTVEALGAIGSYDAAEVLVSVLQDSPDDLFGPVIEAVEQIGNLDSIPVLLKAIGHPHPMVRRAIIGTAGRLKANSSLPSLVTALEDESAEVRRTAIKSLIKMEGSAPIDALIQALVMNDSYVRRQATRELGRRRAVDAVSSLSLALRDSDSRIRLEAATALSSIGTPSANAALHQAKQEKLIE